MNTRFLEDGDKGKTVCGVCKRMVTTTYLHKDYVLKSGVRVQNVLQSFCDVCGKVDSIPAQSAPRLREYMVGKESTIEIRVTPTLEDALYTIGDKSGMNPPQALRSLIAFYGKRSGMSLKKLGNHPLLKKPRKSRISVKMTKEVEDTVISRAAGLSLSKSEYLVTLLIKAKEDLLDNRHKGVAKKYYEAMELIGV